MNSRPHVTFGFLLVALVLGALDQTITSTALPSIARELHASPYVAWVFSCYLIAATVAIPLYGRLADLRGPRWGLLLAVSLFLVGSGLCACSRTMPELLLARAVQGAGAGGLLTLTTLATMELFAPWQQGRYQALLGSALGLATVLGPIVGGAVVEHLSWRWLFAANIPIGALVLAGIAKSYPAMGRSTEGSIDYAGSVALSLAVVAALVLTMQEMPGAGSLGVPRLLLAVATAALLVLFVRVERKAAHPLLPLTLFASREFRAMSVLSAVSGIALFTGVVFLQLFLQNARGMTPLQATWHILPMMAGISVAAMASGSMMASLPPVRALAAAGTLASAVGYALLASQLVDITQWTLWVCLVLVGAGLGLLFPVLTVVAQRSAHISGAGSAIASSIMFRSLGGALGVAALGSVFGQGVTQVVTAWVRNGRHGALPLEAAYVSALQPVFYAVAILCAAAWLSVRALPRHVDYAAPAALPAGSPFLRNHEGNA